MSIFSIFIIELVAFRWGTTKLAQLGIAHDPHGHGVGGHAAHGPEPERTRTEAASSMSSVASEQAVTVVEKEHDIEAALETAKDAPLHRDSHRHAHGHGHPHSHGVVEESTATQIVGIAILEFGVILHRSVRFTTLMILQRLMGNVSSVLIGLTLAVTDNFKILFIVLVFHRKCPPLSCPSYVLTLPSETFEGLGVGSRLAYMDLPHHYNHIPVLGAALFGITTPIGSLTPSAEMMYFLTSPNVTGIAIGLGVRSTYNPESTTASIVSGVLDAFSAGILIYTGLVEVRLSELSIRTTYLPSINAATCTRIPLQQRNDHSIEWQAHVRHRVHDARMYPNGRPWPVGVNRIFIPTVACRINCFQPLSHLTIRSRRATNVKLSLSHT